MIKFRVNGRSDVPTYVQIVQQVRQALRMGMLELGDQLPSVREVVAETAINPNTVLKAYRDLEREGLVEARSGQGTFVRALPPGPPPGTHSRLGRKLALRESGSLEMPHMLGSKPRVESCSGIATNSGIVRIRGLLWSDLTRGER